MIISAAKLKPHFSIFIIACITLCASLVIVLFHFYLPNSISNFFVRWENPQDRREDLNDVRTYDRETLHRPTTMTTPSIPSPTPTVRHIPSGRRAFSVSQSGTVSGPRFSRGTIDPYDPTIGQSQSVTIRITDSVPVGNASVRLKTDTKEIVYPLSLISGTQLDGQWGTSWEMQDSYLYRYHVLFEAKSGNGSSIVDVTLR